MRYLFSILFILSAGFVSAQETDSLFVVKKEGNWEIKYTAKARETAKMLCKRFHVDESQMEYANDEGTMKKMTEGQTVHIPLGKNNFVVTKPVKLNASRNLHELYYKVVARDEIAMLSTYSGVTKSELREWNALKGNTLRQGQILFIGWVKMVMKDSTDPATYAAWPAPPKKPVALDTTGNMPVPGGLDTIYNRQTNNGLNVLTEKGTAVFFEKPGRNNMYYAFHNEAARGSIIRVHNPGTGKTTYVKVLGPLPDTKLYANCVIGISDGAREALGIVNDNKAWCELSYAAN